MPPKNPEQPAKPDTEPSVELKENQRRFDNAHFKPRKTTAGKIVGWQSSEPGRKVIELPAFLVPERPRNTKEIILSVIAEDGNPDEPDQGKFTAFMLAPEDQRATPQDVGDWTEEEAQADTADRISRERNIAHQSLRRATGQTMAERATQELKLSPGLQRVAEVATERARSAEEELEMIVGPADSPVRELIDLRREELYSALRTQRSLEAELQNLNEQRSDIMRTFEGKPDPIAGEVLAALREQEEKIRQDMTDLRQSSPEAFIGLNLRELKAMRPTNERIGRITETPSRKELIDDITTHLLGNHPVLIHGHMGVGKTELAMYTAHKMLEHRGDLDAIVADKLTAWKKEHPAASITEQMNEQRKLEAMHKSAVVISGSKQASLGELYGHQILTLDSVGHEDIEALIKEVTEKYDAWVEDHPEASEADRNRTHDLYTQAFMSQSKNGTISKFFLGPIYTAMEEGRPIIIDEVNAFRHEILISLNHILTRKAGDIVNVQQNSGTAIEVQRGFGVIMTGNINNGEEIYVDRQQLDPAFLSRLYRLEMDYMPQAVEGPLDEASNPKVDNELFRAMVAKMIDRNGNLSGPEESLEKLWDLAKAGRIIQDVFAGRQVKLKDSKTGEEKAVDFKQDVERGVDAKLNEAVFSLRSVNNIIDQWQSEGYRYELDYYLYQEFVGQTIDATDRAYLYQILHNYFGFFKGPGWPADSELNFGSGGKSENFRVTPPKNAPGAKIFQGPRDYLEKIYGQGPARQRFPERAPKAETAEDQAEAQRERLLALQKFLTSSQSDLGHIRGVLATPEEKPKK